MPRGIPLKFAAEMKMPRAKTSDVRRAPVGIPTGASTLRSAQVKSVGATFLRIRPLVVLPVAVVNATALFVSNAPVAQRIGLAGCIACLLTLFVTEAWFVRRRDVGTRWLAISLGVTLVGLAGGCALSGGLASPLLPLLTAPLAVGFAAFGRGAPTRWLLAVGAALALGLALVPEGVPFASIAPTSARVMLLASLGGAAALAYAGVAGLVEAHARTAEVLDRMRVATLEEAASRMRATEQMGAKVAHELKNPLAAVRALLQLLAESANDPRAGKRASVAIGEVDRMDGIVRDYLAFSRPLAELRLERVDALELARDVVSVLEARADAAGVTLTVTGSTAALVADPRRVREALLNLTANALAATSAGGAVRLLVDKDPRGVRIRVEDEGSGMTQDVLERLGTPFFTTHENEGGTGLGVVLARAAIRQHGGDVTFSSSPGRGTIVAVDLPEAAVTGAALESP